MKELDPSENPKKKIGPTAHDFIAQQFREKAKDPYAVFKDVEPSSSSRDAGKESETFSPEKLLPKPDEYTKPKVDTTNLEAIIEQSSFLQAIAEKNPSQARYYAYLREQVRKIEPNSDGKRIAYYPGIGGGDAPIDPLSAFYSLDVDGVIGIDLLDGRNADEKRVDIMLERKQATIPTSVNILSADASSAEFEFDGKKRKLLVHKGDARTIIPSPTPSIIYQKKEAQLIKKIPDDVIDAAQIIYCLDDSISSSQAAKFCLEKGFDAVDIGHVYEALGQKIYWPGDPQLLLRPDKQTKE